MDKKSEEGNQPLSSTLFTAIQKDILSGQIRSGEKLTEQRICKQYDVSRTPVREALRQLEADGLIENIPHRGAFAIGLSRRDISDLFDLRALFEMKAVEWAIQRMSDEDVDRLRENVEFMEFYTLKGDTEKVLSFNSQFHDIIYKGTGNRMLYQTLHTYQTYLKHSAPPKTFTDDYLTTILSEHRAIFNAFESRNPIEGREAMQQHKEHSKLRRMSKFF